MKVKNVNGSGQFSKPSTGESCWREYWEKRANFQFKDNYSYQCPACGNWFSKEKIHGAHVKKEMGDDKSWYIAPLCEKCNQRTDSFDINVKLIPVPSNYKD